MTRPPVPRPVTSVATDIRGGAIAATATTHPIEHPAVPRSTGRVLDLLEAVVDGGEGNLTAVAGATGLTPTTALRHLRALETRGYVSRDDAGVFSPGPRLLRLAAIVHDEGSLGRLTEAARPHLEALAAETGESTYLAIVDGRTATYVATVESRHAIRHVGWVGQSVPLEGTAVGAALTDGTDPVTRTGAVEPDITAVARALPTTRRPRAAMSVIGPSHRLDDRLAEIEAALVAATDRLATELGQITDGSVAS